MHFQYSDAQIDFRPLNQNRIQLASALERFKDCPGHFLASEIQKICAGIWFHYCLLGERASIRASEVFLEVLREIRNAGQMIKESGLAYQEEVLGAIAAFGANLLRFVEDEYQIPTSKLQNYRWW